MRRELRLGQALYFVLWDEDSDEAGVAKGEVVQYASDYSKVRVKVVEAPQNTVIGRTVWVLPERLDDDARSARVNYQRRARQELRAAESGAALDGPAQGEGSDVSEETAALWRKVAEGWADVDLLVDSVDFEAGWPEHQERLAKFATVAVQSVRPDLSALLDALPGGDEADAVRAALSDGILGTAERLGPGDPCALLRRWEEVPATEAAGAADAIVGLRTALDALAERHRLAPALAAAD